VTEPFLEYVDEVAPRLREAPPSVVLQDPAPPRGTGVLVLLGLAVLGLGFAALGTGNFVADQFSRAPWLGWLTAAIAVGGFLLVGAGIWRELRALFALDRVDRLRADLASGDAVRVMAGARAWAARVPGGDALLPALHTVNDPDAALALLRAGPGRALRDAADSIGRTAAVQTVAGIAAMPSPSLDILLVGWRGVRLVRQVATVYGVRPGLLGTLSLLRRTALSATMVGAVDLAGNTLAHGLLSSPLLAKLAGEAATAGVAARRMLVLGRAAAAACDPVPPG
jgi:putative membrane protein